MKYATDDAAELAAAEATSDLLAAAVWLDHMADGIEEWVAQIPKDNPEFADFRIESVGELKGWRAAADYLREIDGYNAMGDPTRED